MPTRARMIETPENLGPIDNGGGGGDDSGMLGERVAHLESDMQDVKASLGRLEDSGARVEGTVQGLEGTVQLQGERLKDLRTKTDRLEHLVERLGETGVETKTKVEGYDNRFDTVDQRFDAVGQRLDATNGIVERNTREFAEQRKELQGIHVALARIEGRLSETPNLLQIMAFCISVIFATGGIVFAAMRFGPQ